MSFITNECISQNISYPKLEFVEQPTPIQTDALIEEIFQLQNNSQPLDPIALKRTVSVIKEETLSLFRQNKILARAMQQEVTADIELDFTSFRNELNLMKSADKLKTASCTLLVPGQEVATYKPYGFIFNGKTSDVIHAAPNDINKVTDENGGLVIHSNDQTMTLEELAKFIVETPVGQRAAMNEVNCNFQIKDLSGLFVNESKSKMTLIDIIIVQSWIKKKYELDLPIFIYDQKKGILTPYQNTKANATELWCAFKSAKGVAYAKSVAPYLGLEVSDKGRLIG